MDTEYYVLAGKLGIHLEYQNCILYFVNNHNMLLIAITRVLLMLSLLLVFLFGMTQVLGTISFILFAVHIGTVIYFLITMKNV